MLAYVGTLLRYAFHAGFEKRRVACCVGSLLGCVRYWVAAGLLTDLGVNRIFELFELLVNRGKLECVLKRTWQVACFAI